MSHDCPDDGLPATLGGKEEVKLVSHWNDKKRNGAVGGEEGEGAAVEVPTPPPPEDPPPPPSQ